MTSLLLVILAVAALTVVLVNLKNAPEAYEDESGFHILRKRMAGSKISRSRKKAYVGSLREAKAAR